ncbi:response regulator transcription factor [Candidatus Cryosericum odellii]|uniref:DNA-binding response regulator n=1 Tax=Candidatus Cryosericum odellii TaxID=2290917 RepID=A0A398CYR0_9BACT|nr:response regulator transcription factor [Candidatus Cryosericum odellii]RIE07795.1 DNA-binding response regulator [Candidatus Cryosericum odellii]RIE10400.1 DNA-binding response regulator [Candidatus Cryosericum odellii]
MRILVVEDERSLSDAICEGLRDNFFAVDQAFDGREALSKIEIELYYDLIILDIMLSRLDGIALLKELRKRGHKMAVLMLTARSGVDDKVESFTGGADDYLTKPFDFRELLARVHALLRRDKETKTSVIVIRDLLIDTSTNTVLRGSAAIELTKKEFQILVYLALNRGRIVPKEELENHLWDEHASLWSDTLRTHIKNLRKKIDSGSSKNLIRTLRGIGYEIDAD